MSRSVGFTGTQQGMSDFQKESARQTLIALAPDELHHGDCVGADAEIDAIARELGIAVIIHPPSDAKKQARCARPGDVVWEPLPYLDRNKDIVESSGTLIAAPLGPRELLRSGTWSTVRFARSAGREVIVLARAAP